MADIRQVSRRGRHFYEYDQDLLPSVTTILRAVNKPALVGWAAKVTAEWAVENKAVWYGLPPERAVDILKKVRFRKNEADLGSRVHEAVLEDGDSDGAVAPFVAQFDEWVDDVSFTRTAAEVPVVYDWYTAQPAISVDTVDVEYGVRFGGTVDLLGTANGHKTLIDVKTGKGVYDEHWLQVEAYARCNVGLPFAPERVGILHLRPDEWTFHQEPLNDARWRAFLGAYDVALWQGILEP